MMYLADIGLVITIIFTFIILLTLFSHLWWSMPFVPTPPHIVAKMMKAAGLKAGDTVYDLGAGDGRLLIAAKKACPKIHAEGYEVALAVWLLGKLRIALSGQDISFRMKSLFAANLSDADVIFVYLLPSFMDRLSEKFAAELKPGTRIISYTFGFKDRKGQLIEGGEQLYWGKQRIFKYVWK